MKVHYFNILLFPHALNILVNTHKKTSITPKIPTTRLLCECELYAPANYDNDPQMKKIMDNFNKQTQERFHEYDERLQSKRMQCKDKCDKEIQKIILKDKLEKQMAQQLSTLDTNITTEDIPTCVCEKSLADKTEKFCLNCGKNMGAIAPWWGLVCGSGYAGWSHYIAGITAKLATEAGIKAGVNVGLAKVKVIITKMLTGMDAEIPPIKVADLMAVGKFTDGVSLDGIFKAINSNAGQLFDADRYSLFSTTVQTLSTKPKSYATQYSKEIVEVATAFDNAKAGVLAEGANTTSILTNTIIASVVAIVVIVLIMVIIYLILRYRRKKKMKKKVQYIKFIEE
ncbi:rifin PIR protein,putative [Plasmodium sp. DRC-Itaito]|nr:rifin PIR protein,putative [Plasmodium sp. DRC-Itaito]